jgi:hypothetical protein
MAPRDPHDFHSIGRAGVELLLQTGYYAEQDKLAAQRQKVAEKRWKEAGRHLKRIRRGKR